MTPGKHWQTGTLRIQLEFIPDEVEVKHNLDGEIHDTEIDTISSEVSPLDDIRQSLLNQSED